MTTLFLGTPEYKVKTGSRSFKTVLATGIGDGYCLSETQVIKLNGALKRGDDVDVVVLRKDRQKSRAQGRLVGLKPTGRYANRRQRYDVEIKDLGVVSYEPGPSLYPWGVVVQ